MLVHDPKERKKIATKNRLHVLQFLAFHRYSTLEVITISLGFKSKSAASSILKKLCLESYVSKGIVKDEISRVTLFGITKKGIAEFKLNAKNHFIKSRVALRTLAHKLAIQRGHIYLKNKLINNKKMFFTLPDYGEIKKLNGFKSDLVCELLNANNSTTKILVEAELTLKSEARYKEIFFYFYNLKKENEIHKVFYIVTNEKKKEKLLKIINNLEWYIKNKENDLAGKKIFSDVYGDLFSIKTLNELTKN